MTSQSVNSLAAITTTMKRLYVLLFKWLRIIASKIGLLRALDARKNNRTVLWLRSLFAIYDIDEMFHLGVPWWTFQSIDTVERFLESVPQARVFEYGAGASTVWLASRAGSVYFLEHDAEYKKIVDRYTANCINVKGFLEVPVAKKSPAPFTSQRYGWQGMSFKNYVECLDDLDGFFNLIVIDGRCREQCLKYALRHLSETGCIVFDNSGRKRYHKVLKRLSYPKIETKGLTPCLPYPGQTTLIFKTAAMRDKLQVLSEVHKN